ncbi:MAG: hypothetical protein H7Z16_14235 [Pyrinomonadaceae bacterium]|nr:hypothetical protein [Pyrinomonadaceae bacterium]
MGQFDTFVERYFNRGFVGQGTTFEATCWLTTIQEGGGVSYVRSPLRYQHGASADAWPILTGVVDHRFDDRTAAQNFDPNSADQTRITFRPIIPLDFSRSISVPGGVGGGGGGIPGELTMQVELESITWGGRYRLQGLKCRANVISGYGSPIGNPPGVSEALYALSLGPPTALPG